MVGYSLVELDQTFRKAHVTDLCCSRPENIAKNSCQCQGRDFYGRLIKVGKESNPIYFNVSYS